MAGFIGSDFQINVQKRIQARRAWIEQHPEVANGGRVLNFLDPEETGWDTIARHLEKDGVVVLTAQPRDRIEARARAVFGDGYDYPSWDIYIAAALDVVTCCQTYLAHNPLGDGWTLTCSQTPSDDVVEAIQSLNLNTGVAPYPGYYTQSDVVPSMTACLWDTVGTLVATSSVNARYHPKSRLGGYVFKGSTSVSPQHRGQGFGKLVNSRCLLASQTVMGWTHALSQVATDNIASQRTIIASGFVHQPQLMTLAVVAKGEVFTR